MPHCFLLILSNSRMQTENAVSAAHLLLQSVEAALPKQKKNMAVTEFKHAMVAHKRCAKAHQVEEGRIVVKNWICVILLKENESSLRSFFFIYFRFIPTTTRYSCTHFQFSRYAIFGLSGDSQLVIRPSFMQIIYVTLTYRFDLYMCSRARETVQQLIVHFYLHWLVH